MKAKFLLLLAGWAAACAAHADNFAITGYAAGRVVNPALPQFAVDNTVFDVVDDVILSTQPYLDQLKSDSYNLEIDNFLKRTEGRGAARFYSNTFTRPGILAIFNDPAVRQEHFENVIAFLKKHNFDGLDLDWEYPESSEEWHAFSLYIEELGKQLHQNGMKLSAALSAWGVELTPEAVATLDQVNIMSYDMPGENAGRDHSCVAESEEAIQFFLERGFKPEQLALGIPFYGLPASRKDSFYSAYHYRDGLRSSYKTFVLNGSRKLADSNQFDTYWYDGFPKLREKIALVQKYNLRGVMLWEIGFDLPVSDPASLLRFLAIEGNANRLDNLPPEQAVSLPWPGGAKRDIILTATPEKDRKPDLQSAAYRLESTEAIAPEFYEKIYGQLHPPQSGTYRIRVQSSDQIELSINDTLHLSCSPGETISQSIYLEAHKPYPFVLEHWCKDGTKADFSVSWQLPEGNDFEVIGPYVLTP